jgi:hypothetical protein
MLRRIFGPKRERVSGNLRRLHYEELYNLYASPNIIRVNKSVRMGWSRHIVCVGATLNLYKILVRKPEGKGPRRPRNR